MGALPKRKVSRARRGDRRREQVLKVLPMGPCNTCGALKPTHRACKLCGTYNGHQILTPRASAQQAE